MHLTGFILSYITIDADVFFSEYGVTFPEDIVWVLSPSSSHGSDYHGYISTL